MLIPVTREDGASILIDPMKISLAGPTPGTLDQKCPPMEILVDGKIVRVKLTLDQIRQMREQAEIRMPAL